jgi:hypothetical protein
LHGLSEVERGGDYMTIMRRLGLLVLLIAAAAYAQDKVSAQDSWDKCIADLSGYPPDTVVPQATYPSQLDGVSLQYVETGCFGACPVFQLVLRQESVQFKGLKYVRVKGNHKAALSKAEFERFLRKWFAARFYAMRDNYCSIKCPDGLERVVVDLRESSITLKTPDLSKEVYQCFATLNGKPETPKPPDEYFQLTQDLQTLAREHGWL